MGNRGLYTLTSLQNGYQEKEMSIGAPMQSSQLRRLFEDELKDIYWVERALTNAIPKMIKNATSQELIEALTEHLEETENQVGRVERVFELMEKKPVAKRCLAMEGLLKEVGEMMASCDPGAMCDAGIISAELKVEHFKMASYETLRQFAETLGIEDAVILFEATLDEQKASIEKFAGVSVSATQVHEHIEEEDEDERELESEQEYYLQFV